MRLALMLFWLAFAAQAADFNKGVAAFGAGDYAAAMRELKPFAENGIAVVQFVVGSMYAGGMGVPQDYKEAIRWFRLAAEQGYADAQTDLGLMYDRGQGVAQDSKEAGNLYRLAAEQGHVKAMFLLSLAYSQGHGVPQDYVLGYMWSNIAAASGVKNSAEARELNAEQMTPSQIEKAQDLTRACIAKNYKGC